MTSSDIKSRSLTEEGRTRTRENLERELDVVASLARERDDEPDDQPDAVVDGETVFGLLRRPVRRYLGLRKQGSTASRAAVAVAGHVLNARPDDPKVTKARIRFSALTHTIRCLDDEDRAEDVFKQWSKVIERTHRMKLALEQWARDATVINGAIEDVVRATEGKYVSLLPELPRALAYLDVAEQLLALEHDFGDVAALICPDVLNFSQGGGGKRTNYSLGRLLVVLSEGCVHENDVAAWRPAYSFIERTALVVDDADVGADDGREDRYATAEKRYAEWRFTRIARNPPAATE
jgi:hypothetical protein